jgi:hypothetical protein
MAKRNLARTAIEGGRASSTRWEEYFFTRSERRSARIQLQRCKVDSDSAEDLSVGPRKALFGRDFADKLGPVRRWLAAQVGRHWDDVNAEIHEKFPGRSLAGRHILGHIESDVAFEGHHHRSYGVVLVDEQGIVRPFPRHLYRSGAQEDRARVEALLHWFLDHGFHKALNHAMARGHVVSFKVMAGYDYSRREVHAYGNKTFLGRGGVPIYKWESAAVSPRLLLGKHDVEAFLRDVIAGLLKGTKEHHGEWRNSLVAFIRKIRPDFDLGVYGKPY